MVKSKNILITGVSSGIGYDLARVFVENGYVVFGSVRKQLDADRLLADLGKNFKSLLFDVTDHVAVDKAALWLEKEIEGEGLGGLINNAGIAVSGSFVDLTIDDYWHQFEVNVFGLIKVTQAFLPLLGTKSIHHVEPGKIVQISSVAGKFGMPFMSAYAGSKHALEGISDSLRRELLKYGIDVILIEPGPIKTPIWNKGIKDSNRVKFADSEFASSLDIFQNSVRDAVKSAWASERVAGIIFKAFKTEKSRTRYVLTPHRFKNWMLPKVLSTRLIDKIIGKKLKLIK